MATIPFKNVIFMMQTHLSLSPSTTQLSASPSPSPSDSSSSTTLKTFTKDYLTTKCGLSLKSAIAISRKIHIDDDNIQRSDAVISLLKSHGFDDPHISEIIQKFPIILNRYKVEENLKPKLEFLVEYGFSGPHLHDLVVSTPRILGTSLSGRIKPSLDFLRSFLGSEERVRLSVMRNPRLLTHNLKPNVDLLVKEGVPVDDLTNFLLSNPYIMQPKVDRLVAALKVVKKKLCVPYTDPMFLHVVLKIASVGVSLWRKKLRIFKSFGFSPQEGLSIFKRYPECFGISGEKLAMKLDFYLNTVKLETGAIITHPVLLGLAIETRVRPRHNVLKLLLSKKLLKEDTKFAHIFIASEAKFLSKYVTRHLQQVPNLLEIYNNDRTVN